MRSDMSGKQHWTARSDASFIHKLAFDFIVQLEKRIESEGISQSELAKRLGVSEGAVSQVLNNPQNLTLKTIARYSRALGMKAAIVAYDDGDRDNEQGLVSSEIFSTCWEHAGKPRDFWTLDEITSKKSATTSRVEIICSVEARTFPFDQSMFQPVFISGAYALCNFSTAPVFRLQKATTTERGEVHYAGSQELHV